MHLSTAAEQARIKAWLGYILSSFTVTDSSNSDL